MRALGLAFALAALLVVPAPAAQSIEPSWTGLLLSQLPSPCVVGARFGVVDAEHTTDCDPAGTGSASATCECLENGTSYGAVVRSNSAGRVGIGAPNPHTSRLFVGSAPALTNYQGGLVGLAIPGSADATWLELVQDEAFSTLLRVSWDESEDAALVNLNGKRLGIRPAGYSTDYTTAQFTFDGSGNFGLTGTVDGVDVSAHAANPNAHHTPPAVPVDSVFGRVGAVVQQSGDYSCSQVTGCPTTAVTGAGSLIANRLPVANGTGSVTDSGIVAVSGSLSSLVGVSGSGNVNFSGTTHNLEGSLQVDEMDYEGTVPTGGLFTRTACFETGAPATLGLCTSSRSVKHRIRSLRLGSAEAALLALRPALFHRNGDEAHGDRAGFVAEEMQGAFSRAGIRAPADQVDYDATLSVLVRVVQEQQERIAVLEERVAALEQE